MLAVTRLLGKEHKKLCKFRVKFGQLTGTDSRTLTVFLNWRLHETWHDE